MYSINVFITFSLTELGMARHWIKDRAKEPKWKSQLAIHGTGLVMCVSILVVTIFEKFSQGGWITVVITSRRHRALLRDPPPLRDVRAGACGASTRS